MSASTSAACDWMALTKRSASRSPRKPDDWPASPTRRSTSSSAARSALLSTDRPVVSDHPLAGTFSVEASARRIRNYRYAEERMMRALGGWIALTPELAPKLLFGRHVWDCAQHADAWGKRLPELRSPAQRSEPANDGVVRFMALVEAPDGPDQTAERLVSVYRVLKPHVLAVYERHLASANRVYEPPTRRILERCISDERRHVGAAVTVLERLIS